MPWPVCTLRYGGVPLNWDSKRRAYSCFPIELDWVLGFTVAVQPNLRAVKCQHALYLYHLGSYKLGSYKKKAQRDTEGVDKNSGAVLRFLNMSHYLI